MVRKTYSFMTRAASVVAPLGGGWTSGHEKWT